MQNINLQPSEISLQPAELAEAAALLRAGGLVAFPTETVYGLGANALDAQAVARIFAAKGRPASDPLIVHLAEVGDLAQVVAHVPAPALMLARHFWPGPLTLVLPRAPHMPPALSAGRATLAVRVPAHPIAQALLRAAGLPIAAPSANRFGHTSPTTAAHVRADLAGQVDLVLDGGPSPLGLESTVLDLSGATPTLLRPGGVSLEELRAVLGDVALGNHLARSDEGLPAPGMLVRHYAPDSPLTLIVGPRDAALTYIAREVAALHAHGQQAGLLLPDEDSAALAALGADSEALGAAADLAQIAQRLYAALRALDSRRPAQIFARDLGTQGLARALRDRLTRAASGRVVDVTVASASQEKTRAHQDTKPTIRIDGLQFDTLEGFYEHFSKQALKDGIFWGRNLDAFDDVLSGGFGTLDQGFVLEWLNHGVSKEKLGYAETIRQLQLRLEHCHSANIQQVEEQLAIARCYEGPTVFDWLEEIIWSHGAGREKDNGIELVLK